MTKELMEKFYSSLEENFGVAYVWIIILSMNQNLLV
jgi:hypothetical protein